MLITFNCGVGMVVCVAAENAAATLNLLTELGETAFVMGEIVAGEGKAEVSYH
jgi:phosphoribosylformylglycinamidine cyclo-ligase